MESSSIRPITAARLRVQVSHASDQTATKHQRLDLAIPVPDHDQRLFGQQWAINGSCRPRPDPTLPPSFQPDADPAAVADHTHPIAPSGHGGPTTERHHA
ncbi:hypothetical protein ACLOJK_035037 [Asimina triloba]